MVCLGAAMRRTATARHAYWTTPPWKLTLAEYRGTLQELGIAA